MSSSRSVINKAKSRNVSLPTLFEIYSCGTENSELKADQAFWPKSSFQSGIENEALPEIANNISNMKLCASKASKEFALSIMSPKENASCPLTIDHDLGRQDFDQEKRNNNRIKHETFQRQVKEIKYENHFYGKQDDRVLMERRFDDKMLSVHNWVRSQASIQYDIASFDDGIKETETLPEIGNLSATDTANCSVWNDVEKQPMIEKTTVEKNYNVIAKTPRIRTRLIAGGKETRENDVSPGSQQQIGNKTVARSFVRSRSNGETERISVEKIPVVKSMKKNCTTGDANACSRTATPLPTNVPVGHAGRLSIKQNNFMDNKRKNENNSPFGNSAFSWPSFNSDIRDLHMDRSKQITIARPLSQGNILRSLSTDT